MKIVTQNFKNGQVRLIDAPPPQLQPGGVLVRTRASLISVGTDRSMIHLSQKTSLQKAKERPDLVKRVIGKVKTDGLMNTYRAVKNIMEAPLPLGYSLAGEVSGVGAGAELFQVGDRVACAGAGYANHAELVWVPKNLVVPVPGSLSWAEASFVTLGAIAVHGVRQAEVQFGATVAIIGLGLVGQLAARICLAAGYRVVGVDIDPARNELARISGVLAASEPSEEIVHQVLTISRGIGADAVIVCAAAKDSSDTLRLAADLVKDRGRVVVVGDVGMDIPRREYYAKEIEVRLSRSYGPGRYDPDYEEKGRGYPPGYVRWTETENMSSFLDLVAAGRIRLDDLISHQFPIEQAEAAYGLVTGQSAEPVLGMVLTYPADPDLRPRRDMSIGPRPAGTSPGQIDLGLIGAGAFAKGVLLPTFMAQPEINLSGVAAAKGYTAMVVAERYQAEFSASEAETVLADPQITAVAIATRHDSHAALAIQALNRGKHVFLEKPLCIREEELAAVMTAVADHPELVLMVGFNRRFSPLAGQLKAHFAPRSEPLALIYRVNAGRIPLGDKSSWVHDPELGGGRIIGEVCHFVDLLLFLTGARPVWVQAGSAAQGRQTQATNDVVTLTISFDDGSLGTIHYFANGSRAFPKERLEVFGQEKTAVLDNFRTLELASGKGMRKIKRMNQQKGFEEEVAAFVQGIKENTHPIPWPQLLDTTLVTFRALDSLRTGLPVRIG
ncbi:MAG: bi-domain-containing oxidoreductase [Deltaproteobacteria bacterium]|nr:bi-domain-containing oxidoreductase [Deltaproteobacteria bacterium]